MQQSVQKNKKRENAPGKARIGFVRDFRKSNLKKLSYQFGSSWLEKAYLVASMVTLNRQANLLGKVYTEFERNLV